MPRTAIDTPTLPLDDGGGDDLADATSGASLTRSELCSAADLSAAQLAELEEYGLVAPSAGSGERVVFDEQALVVARIVSGLRRARHRAPTPCGCSASFAEREAGLYDQVIAPRLKRKNPEARAAGA